MIIKHYNIPINSKVFLLDLDDQDIVGPFTIIENNSELRLGSIETSSFILQYIIPVELYNENFDIELIQLSNITITKS